MAQDLGDFERSIRESITKAMLAGQAQMVRITSATTLEQITPEANDVVIGLDTGVEQLEIMLQQINQLSCVSENLKDIQKAFDYVDSSLERELLSNGKSKEVCDELMQMRQTIFKAKVDCLRFSTDLVPIQLKARVFLEMLKATTAINKVLVDRLITLGGG